MPWVRYANANTLLGKTKQINPEIFVYGFINTWVKMELFEQITPKNLIGIALDGWNKNLGNHFLPEKLPVADEPLIEA